MPLTRLFRSLLFFCLSIAATAAAGPRELSLGTVAMEIPAVMHQRLQPLAAHLSQSLGRAVRIRPALDLSKAVEDVASGNVDIAYLTPAAYIKAQKTGNVRIIAKPVTAKGVNMRLMLVVRNESQTRSVRDLVGRSFAFGDEAAILQRAVVVNAGIQLREFSSYRFLGHYDNIARGVANGDFDAGILKDSMARAWEQKGLRILHASPELPPYNIVVGRNVSPALELRIRAALLNLNASDPEHRKVLTALDSSHMGFVPAADSDYDIVRALIQPFQK